MVYTKSYLERVYEVPENHVSEPGTREHFDRFPVYDEKGRWHLVMKEKPDNKYLEIQSHKDSCDINVLMARYQNGETDILAKVQGFFGDITEIPNDYASMLNIVMHAEENFKSLPLDVRERFGQSFTEYLATAGTADWLARLGIKPVEPGVAEITDPPPRRKKRSNLCREMRKVGLPLTRQILISRAVVSIATARLKLRSMLVR